MDLRPLRRHRDFRLLFAAQFISFLGGMVTYVALPFQMYSLTKSSLAVGLLGLAELLPLLVTAFVGGALADSVDRRRLVIAAEMGLAGGCGLLMLNAAREHPSVAALYLAAALMSGLNGLQRPSIDALTPRLVDKDEIPAAAALGGFRGSVGMIAGPALGGLLAGTFGPMAAYGVNALTYVLAIVCFRAIRSMPPPKTWSSPAWSGCAKASAMPAAARSSSAPTSWTSWP